MEEIGKADDYGLRASDYTLPKLDSIDRNSARATPALADAEVKLNIAMLRYARDARGGRFDWTKINPNLDPTLALPDPTLDQAFDWTFAEKTAHLAQQQEEYAEYAASFEEAE